MPSVNGDALQLKLKLNLCPGPGLEMGDTVQIGEKSLLKTQVESNKKEKILVKMEKIIS